jgi:hypothetical protein
MKTTDNIKVHPAAIKLLTDSTWQFARNILWGGHSFSETETQLAKIFIEEYYRSIPAEHFMIAAPRYFAEYCERIMLAKRYVDRYAHRYIPHPCIWMNPCNPKGFSGTKAWFDHIQKKRGLQRLLSELGIPSEVFTQFKSAINF